MSAPDESLALEGEPTQHGEPAARYYSLCRQGPPPDVREFLRGQPGCTPRQLVAVLRVEQRERRRAGTTTRASDYLVAFPEVRADPEAVLELIYGEYLLREELGETPTLEEYAREFPAHAERLALQVGLHRALQTADDPEGSEAPAAEGASFGPEARAGRRFRIIRRHARGGVGEVDLAFDHELRREVALKVMSDGLWADPDRRGRFVREAELTGSLEHPGVVPVYSLGRNPGGQPYYAMRFIRGETLLERITRFHAAGARGEDPSARALALRQVLRRFLDVCNAVGYAHGRGVLHRDLKPSNVLLGPHGETLVIDWGLARGSTDPSGPGAPSGRPGSDTEPPAPPDPTRSGALIGTPAYMSPEQAEGRPDALGPASDVYSLGATLYHALTGVPPFRGPGVAEVVEKVRRGEFPPPREVRRDVAPALEAVCLKAMARDPAARYPSAAALADDVERWLADEPTSARAEPPLERLARWARRRRALIASAALVSVAVAAASAAAAVTVRLAWLSEREARRGADLALKAERAAHGESARMRGLADANALTARRAVEDFLTRVSENSLLKQQDLADLRGLRKDLLESALGFYEALIRRGRADPSLGSDLADAYFRVGRIRDETGAYEAARDAHAHARDLRRSLLEARPGDRGLPQGLAHRRLHLGGVQAALGRDADAGASYREALEVWEPLRATESADPEVVADQAEAYHRMSMLLARAGRLDDALDRAGRALRSRLVAAHPGAVRYRRDLVASAANIGAYHGLKGDAKAALAALEGARGLLARLVADDPASVELRYYMAAYESNVGATYLRLGRPADAIDAFRRARPVLSQLAANHPSAVRFRASLATVASNLGSLLVSVGKPAEALEPLEQSREAREALAAAQPNVPAHRSGLGGVLSDLARVHATLGHRGEALRCYEEARRALESVPSPDPKDHYSRASVYAQLSSLTGAARPDPALVERALASLRLAAAAGFKERTHAERDTDLDPVRRSRPREFELFLLDLAFPERPFGP